MFRRGKGRVLARWIIQSRAYNVVVFHRWPLALSDEDMLTETRPTNTAEFGETYGTDPELIDSVLLSAAALIASEAADGLRSSTGDLDWIILFRALAELTHIHAESGNPLPCFAATALREKCAELDPAKKVYWLSEEDTARKKFNKAWEKLEASFPGLEHNLRQRAEKKAVPARIFPYNEYDGQDKRTKLFGFHLIAIDLPEGSTTVLAAPAESSPFVQPPVSIEYIEEMEVYPIPGLRRPLRINVQGWRALFMIAPPVLFLAFLAFGSWAVLALWMSDITVRAMFQGTLTVGIFVATVAWFVWPLFRLLEDRIIAAPGILQLNSRFEHVLVIKKEEEIKVVRMVRFTGTCPLCGGLVEVYKGRRLFRGRFVGQCNRNPVEHIFSFDHVLRRGTWLRS